MTIKSVDMQVLVQKVGDVAKIQQVQRTGDENRHYEFNQQISQHIEKNTKTVNQPLHSEFEYIYDKQEKQKRRKFKAKKGNEKKTENNKSNAPEENGKGSRLDIIV
ncbi:MAG: hypothetical protein H5T98_03175 [Syntrophomonadaceae bacterium]|nr:hypothetical protein [Syntrophomonadaceae bacterium]